MKQILKIFIFIGVFSVIVIGCKNEEMNGEDTFYTYELGHVDLSKTNKNNKVLTKSYTKPFIISAKLVSSLKIPNHLLKSRDVILFEKFIKKNKSNIKGTLIFTINGSVDGIFNLENNNTNLIVVKTKGDGEYPGRNECSYEGVRQCIRYNIYEGMNTVGKLICAFAGMGCIAEEAAQCTSRNCFGDVAPNDKIKEHKEQKEVKKIGF